MTLAGVPHIVEAVRGLLRPRRVLGAIRRRLPDPLAPLLGTLVRVETTEPLAALTFDDGPDPECTPRLLEMLAQYGARATFFMLGVRAAAHPCLVAEVAAGGHAIGNHSWDHPSFPTISSRERRGQVRRCDAALGSHAAPLFRPPFGHQNLRARLDLLALRREVVTWDVTATDWLDHEPEWMAERMVRGIRPGSIVLLHDHLFQVFDERFSPRDAMLAALRQLLERLSGTWRFVTVPELLRRGCPRRVRWWRQDPATLAALRAPTGAALAARSS